MTDYEWAWTHSIHAGAHAEAFNSYIVRYHWVEVRCLAAISSASIRRRFSCRFSQESTLDHQTFILGEPVDFTSCLHGSSPSASRLVPTRLQGDDRRGVGLLLRFGEQNTKKADFRRFTSSSGQSIIQRANVTYRQSGSQFRP